MRKIGGSESGVRCCVRLPRLIVEWLEKRAERHGLGFSEEIRHSLIELKSGEDLLLDRMKPGK